MTDRTYQYLLSIANLPTKTCPKCGGKGHIPSFRQDFGRCYRCEGLGKIYSNGARIPSKLELREAKAQYEWEQKLEAVRAEFGNDPRLPSLITKYEAKFRDVLDVFVTPEQAALGELHKEKYGTNPFDPSF